ncbi:MAG: hypothetical protein Q9182_004210 [Xanthomendoza sp. 2 TL-2023]
MPASSKAPTKRDRLASKPPSAATHKPAVSKATPRRKSAPAATFSSSTDPEDDEIASITADESVDSEMEISSSSHKIHAPSSTEDPSPILPPKLITRILYHNLEKEGGEGTKIGKEANKLVGKYMDTFVREAIARAAFERGQADEAAGSGDGFLEVEDLEKLVPQLLLDF